MTYEHWPNTGAMFVNRGKDLNPKRPDYRGTALINGDRMFVASWEKETRNGDKYLTLVFTPYDKYNDDDDVDMEEPNCG